MFPPLVRWTEAEQAGGRASQSIRIQPNSEMGRIRIRGQHGWTDTTSLNAGRVLDAS